MLPGESDFVVSIRRTLGEWPDFHDRLNTLACALIDDGPWAVPTGMSEETIHLLGALLAKACKTHRAIGLCCNSGLGHDAQALGRMLFENVVAILYLLDDDLSAEQRAQRGTMLRCYQFVQASKATAPHVVGEARSAEALEHIKEVLADLERDLGPAVYSSVRRFGFAGRPVERVAADLGLPDSYQLLYRMGSANIHCSDLYQHITIDDSGGDVELHLTPSTTLLRTVFVASNGLMHGALLRVNTECVRNRDEDLSQLGRDMARLL